MNKERLQKVIYDFSESTLIHFFRDCGKFAEAKESLPLFNSDKFTGFQRLGTIEFDDQKKLVILTANCIYDLTERSSKKAQYDVAKKILKEFNIYDAGIFIYYDSDHRFRFSLIYTQTEDVKIKFSDFRRFTYFVSRDQTNNTFLIRIGGCTFSSLEAVKDAFSVEKVTKEFYKQIADWYFWTVQNITFPKDCEAEANGRNIAVIRMITRLIFIWFMKERKLVSLDLFKKEKVSALLKSLEPGETTYYKAILQNLFFATLNTKIKERKFRFTNSYHGKNKAYMEHGIYRYEDYFKNREDMLVIFKDIPFLNGGLFDCLDWSAKESGMDSEVRFDGFSDREVGLNVPNYLFFSGEKEADLNKEYGTKNKKRLVQGLLNILSAYNFTIDESDPNDQEVALDPELLGKVFENLLASFNPETATTARKATGSYNTPREIVDYMVTQSLKQYYKTHLSDVVDIDSKLDELLSPITEDLINPFGDADSRRVVRLTEELRIIDPAVGSGAFPMGILNKLVSVLARVDRDNRLWQEAQLKAVEGVTDQLLKQKLIKQINEQFTEKNSNYGRKLYLIQKCIYGVDIQQIAIEIAKLRFFIALMVDERIDKSKPNWGIEPLPNLDFKLMQGNSLISEFMGINLDADGSNSYGKLMKDETDELIKQFQDKKNEYQYEPDRFKKETLKSEIEKLVAHIFESKLQGQKAEYFAKLKNIERKYSSVPNIQQRNESIKKDTETLNKNYRFDLAQTEKQLRGFTSGQKVKPFFAWKLYFAEVFKEKGGFDIVIANPPYGILNKRQNKSESIVVSEKELAFYKTSKYYEPATGGMLNIFRLFILRSIDLLNRNGIFCEIFPLAFVGDVSTSRLRRYIFDNNEIIFIEAFPERDNPNRRVFEAAKMSVCILSLRKNKDNSSFYLRVNTDRYIDESAEKNHLTKEIINKLDPQNSSFPLTTASETRLLLRIFSNSIRFSEIGSCGEGEVHMTFCKKCFTNNPQNARLLKGAIIDRYQLRTKMSQGDIVYIDEKILFSLKNNLPKDFKNRERIVSQGITGINESSRLKMMIVRDVYCANSLNYLTLKRNIDLKYLLGIFNSKLLNFIFSKFSTNSNVNGYEVDNLPIIIKESFIGPISGITDKILSITKTSDYLENREKQAQVKEYERQIDQMIYQLYGLTPKEIALVDASHK